jgi:hypothetical protein
MAYYVSNIFGLRVGGVFAQPLKWEDARDRIGKIVAQMDAEDLQVGVPRDPSCCMSKEIGASKGTYVVLAGIFNYWTFEYASEFAKRLSAEFSTEVMHMCWDEEIETVQCQVWLAGKPLYEVDENPIGRVLRRVT